MGWASGSTLMGKIIDAVVASKVKPKTRETIYRPIIEAFRDDDWDTVDECLGVDPAFDRICRELGLIWDEDEEDDL